MTQAELTTSRKRAVAASGGRSLDDMLGRLPEGPAADDAVCRAGADDEQRNSDAEATADQQSAGAENATFAAGPSGPQYDTSGQHPTAGVPRAQAAGAPAPAASAAGCWPDVS